VFALTSALMQLGSGLLFAVPTARLLYYYFRWGRRIEGVQAGSLQGIKASLEQIYSRKRDAILLIDVACFVLAVVLMVLSSAINLILLLNSSPPA
jgi:hypothetical protein